MSEYFYPAAACSLFSSAYSLYTLYKHRVSLLEVFEVVSRYGFLDPAILAKLDDKQLDKWVLNKRELRSDNTLRRIPIIGRLDSIERYHTTHEKIPTIMLMKRIKPVSISGRISKYEKESITLFSPNTHFLKSNITEDKVRVMGLTHKQLLPFCEELDIKVEYNAYGVFTHPLIVLYSLIDFFVGSFLNYKPFEAGIAFQDSGVAVNTSFVCAGYFMKREGWSFISDVTMLSRSPQEFFSSLSGMLNSNFIKMTLSALVFGFSTGILYKRLRTKLLIYLEERRARGIREKLCDGDSINAEKLDCIVCYTRIRNTIVLPCNHLYSCSICWESQSEHQKKICSMCKCNVTGLAKLYIS